MTEIQQRITDAVVEEFNKQGMKFTMDDIARDLHISKKTIYREYRDKEALFDHMVDYCFSAIKESEDRILNDPALSTVEKLGKVLVALPESYQSIDFRMIYQLKEKYPEIYAKVAKRIESDWENTIALAQQGMEEGVIRKVPIPILKAMVEATIERFLSSEVLYEAGTGYNDGLQILSEIIMNGIIADK